MGKQKKKKDKKDKAKQKTNDAASAVVNEELLRLRDENEQLRARLEKIAELAQEPLSASSGQDHPDIEDEEYEELSNDVDDEIGGGDGKRGSAKDPG